MHTSLFRTCIMSSTLAASLLIAGCATSGQPAQTQSALSQSSPYTGLKQRIGIVDFEDLTGNNMAGAARDILTERLVNSGRFMVVEREQLERVFTEQRLGMTGAITQKTALKASKLLGLQALVTGKITNSGANNSESGGGSLGVGTTKAQVRVSLRLIDGTTGQILLADSGEGSAGTVKLSFLGFGSGTSSDQLGSKAMKQALERLVDKVIDKLGTKPWTSTVIKSSGGKFYVRAGTLSGLKEGAVLSVRHMGADITDPATGELLGKELSQTIGSLQVAQHANENLSICIPNSGGGFKEGDVVEVAR